VYDSQNSFNFVKRIYLDRKIYRIQGGAFYDGFLYFTCDDGNSYGDNVYSMEVSSGNITRVISNTDNQEMEGIVAHEMDSGILHIMIETKADKNKFYHYSNSDSLIGAYECLK